jgi:hypothetical protein
VLCWGKISFLTDYNSLCVLFFLRELERQAFFFSVVSKNEPFGELASLFFFSFRDTVRVGALEGRPF